MKTPSETLTSRWATSVIRRSAGGSRIFGAMCGRRAVSCEFGTRDVNEDFPRCCHGGQVVPGGVPLKNNEQKGFLQLVKILNVKREREKGNPPNQRTLYGGKSDRGKNGGQLGVARQKGRANQPEIHTAPHKVIPLGLKERGGCPGRNLHTGENLIENPEF